MQLQLARNLRQQLSPAEKKLWDCLRNRKLKRLKSRRQHSIDRYIVDFICTGKRLVVEIDGGIHREAGQKEYDNEQTNDLEGYICYSISNKFKKIIFNGETGKRV